MLRTSPVLVEATEDFTLCSTGTVYDLYRLLMNTGNTAQEKPLLAEPTEDFSLYVCCL
jgi:hypothetical protein